MGMNPTPPTLLGDGVIRRVALSSGHPPAPRLIVLPHLPLGVATEPGTRGNVVPTVGFRELILLEVYSTPWPEFCLLQHFEALII